VSDSWTIILAIAGILFLSGYGMFKGFHRKTGMLKRIAVFRAKPENRPDFCSFNRNVGLAVFNKEGRTIWHNEIFSRQFGGPIKGRKDIKRLLPGFSNGTAGNVQQVYRSGRKVYYLKQVFDPEKEQYLLSSEDITALTDTMARPQDVQPVIACLQLDNLDEVLKQIPVEHRSQLMGKAAQLIEEWVSSLEGYLRPLEEGRYIVFLSQWGFNQAEKNRFALLDKIREIRTESLMPFTLSVGIGINDESPGELGILAQAALDLALERGGDQVVVKSPESVKFYGGRSTSLEKRTKVKARAVAFALRDLIKEAKQVIIMGHEMADYDSMGAALGIAKAVSDLGKKAYVVMDEYNPGAEKLLAALPGETGSVQYIRAEEAEKKGAENPLVIIVDTHKPSLLPVPGLVKRKLSTAVIDHHRRGEEFVPEPKLVYLETYASSASELVTELLQYLGDDAEIGRREATALLAGITVDTKNFMFQTGVRTFEAAAYLRSKGADPGIVQNLLRDNLTTVIKKADVIRGARVLYGKVALGKSLEKSHDAVLMAAKTADTMMNIAGVKAAFVLWPQEGSVALSARSNGEINVQRIMENLGGGGHLTIAAAQLAEPLERAEARLLDVLDEELHYKEV
jgi:c-di-AMP phosphodiesterase-like protein